MTITIEKAQSQAAELCLTILTDAGLIGDNLITKLPAARAAILECLPKMYAACRQVEGETGKNMYLVSKAVVQMFGRGKWADHNEMMGRVEAAFRALIVEAPVVTVEVTEPATATPAVAALVQVAEDSRKGLIARIQRYTSTQDAIGQDKLNEFIIVSRMGCIAYEVVNGSLTPCKDLILAPGSMDEVELSEGLPQHMTVQKRIHAMDEVVERSREALEQIEQFLKGVAL